MKPSAKVLNAETNAPHIGLDKKERAAVAKLLAQTLADTYTLQLKTQFYHWNVTGPYFASLHAMFGEQYDALSAAVDEVAERIRALGQPTPGTFREFLQTTQISEDKTVPTTWQAMVKNLLAGHETCARALHAAIPTAQKYGDEVTADLFITRAEEHEKTAWMLRSLLG